MCEREKATKIAIVLHGPIVGKDRKAFYRFIFSHEANVID